MSNRYQALTSAVVGLMLAGVLVFGAAQRVSADALPQPDTGTVSVQVEISPTAPTPVRTPAPTRTAERGALPATGGADATPLLFGALGAVALGGILVMARSRTSAKRR